MMAPDHVPNEKAGVRCEIVVFRLRLTIVIPKGD